MRGFLSLSFAKHFYDALLRITNYIAVFVIFWMAVWITFDVIGRYFFKYPIPGTTELVKTGICAVVFLGVAYTMQKGKHIRTTVIIERMPPTIKSYFDIMNSLIGATIFTLLCIYAWKAAWASWLVREFDGIQLRVPVYPSRFAVVIGSGLLVIQSLLDIFKHLRSLVKYKGR